MWFFIITRDATQMYDNQVANDPGLIWFSLRAKQQLHSNVLWVVVLAVSSASSLVHSVSDFSGHSGFGLACLLHIVTDPDLISQFPFLTWPHVTEDIFKTCSAGLTVC